MLDLSMSAQKTYVVDMALTQMAKKNVTKFHIKKYIFRYFSFNAILCLNDAKKCLFAQHHHITENLRPSGPKYLIIISLNETQCFPLAGR